MAERPERRYWDAGVFIAWIKGEAGRAPTCEGIIREAQAGRCLIYTSTITLAEVTKIRGGALTERDTATEETISAFFRNEYVKLIPVDYSTGVLARQLIWEFPHLGPRDAIHIATAIRAEADVIETYDVHDFGRVTRDIAAGSDEERGMRLPRIRTPEGRAQGELPL